MKLAYQTSNKFFGVSENTKKVKKNITHRELDTEFKYNLKYNLLIKGNSIDMTVLSFYKYTITRHSTC